MPNPKRKKRETLTMKQVLKRAEQEHEKMNLAWAEYMKDRGYPSPLE